jgi:site-specific DNA recombinase
MKQVRCAIYTRKSSDEGLEQGFNSLDAQREACAAYILSQASEGWSALPDIYDDGGISGGTLERPALQRLLVDVAAGRIDIIVVYKVDRLTRSLLDFSKLVEAFDKANTSFVSITQSFNTTTSMGRLTLNMLLSFAQFEREVTAERIRDKIAASKAKGMWMGGTPPLGYKPDGRTLAIVEEQASLVRDIYRRYLELGNATQDHGHRQDVRCLRVHARTALRDPQEPDLCRRHPAQGEALSGAAQSDHRAWRLGQGAGDARRSPPGCTA